jgi:hypothetical protein
MVKNFQVLAVIIVLLFTATSCQSDRNNQEGSLLQGSYTIEKNRPVNEPEYVSGETIYVPIYSSIFHLNAFRTYDLTATLNIHNIDLENSIEVTKINYHNTNGDLIKAYVEGRLILKPLQTVHIVIHEDDKSGGTGANFIVEWMSESNVSSPIVEAVMISLSGQQGISFTTTGKVIKTLK